jgi:hypothetical protein
MMPGDNAHRNKIKKVILRLYNAINHLNKRHVILGITSSVHHHFHKQNKPLHLSREIYATQSTAYIQAQDPIHTGEYWDVTGHSSAGPHARHSNDLMA